MKRTTHLILGAVVAMPIAVPLSPGLALGAVWWGMVGGGFPDWFDLRSDFRTSLRLRHRGSSHGLPFGVLITVGLWLMLRIFSEASFDLGSMTPSVPVAAIFPWTTAFALGFLSHLLSDAWTHAGVQPLLPFSDTRVWIAPKLLRGKSDGPLDALVRLAAMLALLAGVATYAATHLVIPTFFLD